MQFVYSCGCIQQYATPSHASRGDEAENEDVGWCAALSPAIALQGTEQGLFLSRQPLTNKHSDTSKREVCAERSRRKLRAERGAAGESGGRQGEESEKSNLITSQQIMQILQ